MISRIIIKNFALIEHTEIEFNNGLNVLSGETGSGKSIILDALNFALGAKADKSVIRYGTSECYVSAEFTDISRELKNIFEELDIECEDTVVIKRKFTQEGKSSIKINGETATVGMLKKITSKLVDVHGQSEHYYLLSETNQLEVLDKYCGEELQKLKNQLVEPLQEIKIIKEKIAKLSDSTVDGERRTEILKFQIDEIENADLKENEEDELVELRKKIINAEKIITALSESKAFLEEENACQDLLAQAVKRILNISNYSQEYEKIGELGEEILSKLSDFSSLISDQLDSVDFSQEQAEEIENRLDLIRDIKRKYGQTLEEINRFKETALEEYENIVNGGIVLEKLNKQLSEQLNKVDKLYNKITSLRQNKATIFSQKVTERLKELSMKSAVFSVEFSKEEKLSLNGVDKIEFTFSANKGEPLKSMAKVISGGEMSRLMLALKCEISALQEIPTYIFDEIDAGISGLVAQTVAERLYFISKNKQIIAISHLPQITAMSDTSYLIYKYEDENKTYSSIKTLDNLGKVAEIVRLIGGDLNSSSAVAHANDMLEKAKNFKN